MIYLKIKNLIHILQKCETLEAAVLDGKRYCLSTKS